MAQRRFLIEDLNEPAQIVIDSSSDVYTREIPVWLHLVPSDMQYCRDPLPPLSSSYLKVKDADMPVSFIKNYLVRKLDLQSEDEVEVSISGCPIPSETQLQMLIGVWMKTRPRSHRKDIKVGDSAKEFVMVLSYSRKHFDF